MGMSRSMHPLEATVVRRAQRRVLAALALICSGAWTWSLRLAAQAEGGAGHDHGGGGLWPLAAMWAAMMVAMMIPPEVPRLLWLVSAGRVRRRDPVLHTAVFLAGYLGPWMLASVAAALIQARLAAAGLLTHGMATDSRLLGGTLLLGAGGMQFTPLKRTCLARCRARAALPGLPGESSVHSLARGLTHGSVSLGSCGVLMGILFVTGVMSPLAMALLTGLLVLEGMAPSAWPVRPVAGVLLLGWGAATLLV
jgi:predicted metal-binding membrane protein